MVLVEAGTAFAPIAGRLDPGAVMAALFDEKPAQELYRAVFAGNPDIAVSLRQRQRSCRLKQEGGSLA